MRNNVLADVLELIFDISLKTRILKEWQSSNAARKPKYSGKQILILELADNYDSLTEKELGIIFGMATSSVNDLVEKLVHAGLIEKHRNENGDSREKLIKLTEEGADELSEIKKFGSKRYEYLVSRFQESELEGFIDYLKLVDESVGSSMRSIIFQQY
ncbi:homoprotocatechuate degradation operon regulator, HpaR [Limihaloglobus sulfuriphilus]|uniref:Homoprotocatechuate degradation operon regulator, HpaR n=1 Tax=Limihaloglobus sulfuriphilus TaxID=1851148 RepID=A0A1Q2MFJ2_9BACT|nr:MarR family transcriptional regulator [Limihaloglobus sulfuriphilus]AQQ71429.1 homoprotocatechuate degradation operon regulator, HpaR [Limihaloglobus sulfuriphilus]